MARSSTTRPFRPESLLAQFSRMDRTPHGNMVFVYNLWGAEGYAPGVDPLELQTQTVPGDIRLRSGSARGSGPFNSFRACECTAGVTVVSVQWV